jgi:hypothetical protein
LTDKPSTGMPWTASFADYLYDMRLTAELARAYLDDPTRDEVRDQLDAVLTRRGY